MPVIKILIQFKSQICVTFNNKTLKLNIWFIKFYVKNVWTFLSKSSMSLVYTVNTKICAEFEKIRFVFLPTIL